MFLEAWVARRIEEEEEHEKRLCCDTPSPVLLIRSVTTHF